MFPMILHVKHIVKVFDLRVGTIQGLTWRIEHIFGIFPLHFSPKMEYFASRFWRRIHISMAKIFLSLHGSRVFLIATWLQPLSNVGHRTYYLCDRVCTPLRRLCVYLLVPTSYSWHNKPSVQEEIQVSHLTLHHLSHWHYESQFVHSTPHHKLATVHKRCTRPVQLLPTSLDVQRQNIDVSSSIFLISKYWV